jgi:hypothetical protein
MLQNIADARVSQSLIKDGIGTELNPFLHWIVGEPNFVIFKIAGVALSVIFLWDIYRRYPKLATITASFFLVFYSAILFWNSSLFFM